jgi:hypothetical protein
VVYAGYPYWDEEGFIYDSSLLPSADTNPPSFIEIPTNKVVEIGSMFRYDLNATDDTGIDEWWVNDTTYLHINETGIITCDSLLATEDFGVEVRAYDPYGQYCSATFRISMKDTTNPYWIIEPRDQTINFGDLLMYQIKAGDYSGIDHYSINNTAFVVNNTGYISSTGIIYPGIYGLLVTAYDTHDNNCNASFRLNVTGAPGAALTTVLITVIPIAISFGAVIVIFLYRRRTTVVVTE